MDCKVTIELNQSSIHTKDSFWTETKGSNFPFATEFKKERRTENWNHTTTISQSKDLQMWFGSS